MIWRLIICLMLVGQVAMAQGLFFKQNTDGVPTMYSGSAIALRRHERGRFGRFGSAQLRGGIARVVSATGWAWVCVGQCGVSGNSASVVYGGWRYGWHGREGRVFDGQLRRY
jgi:hypothetical protein